jgi:uncharacterized protein YndB with AHSA1/START domain
MTGVADAVLQDNEGRAVLRFERVLAHPPDRVWRALCETSELAGWHPTPLEFEPRVGGRVRYVSQQGPPPMPDGEVTEYESQRVLGHTWGEDHLHWELRPHQDGCLLVLTHTFGDLYKAARDAAGWHLCLDALSAALDGTTSPSGQDSDGLPKGWRELNQAYERRFEIPRDKATPPPTG